MTKPVNISSIETGTKTSWQQWLVFFSDIGANELSHAEIASKVHEKLCDTVESAGWWAQGVTVAYEQHSGRRVPGQVADGTFEVAVTRTLPGSKEKVMATFTDAYGGSDQLRGIKVESSRSTGTPKRLYWKANLADGTRLIVACEDKAVEKAIISATQVRVVPAEQAQSWKKYWKDQLGEL